MPVARVQARAGAQLRDRREVEAHEVQRLRIVQRAAGGRVSLLQQRSVFTAEQAAVAHADRAVCPRLVALVAALTRWPTSAEPHADHHHALQRHHRHASEEAAAALNRVCILWVESGEVDVGPGVIII